MSVSASDVKKLRDITGAGMMDCKQALSEAEGDFDLAIEILRKKGQKVSAKRAENEAKEGVVIAQVSDDRTRGVIIKLSCETDFVGKSEDFIRFTQSIADLALQKLPATKEELLNLPLKSGITVAEGINELVGKIREKIELTNYERLEAAQVAPYIHSGYRAGVLVGLNKADGQYFDAGRDVAMQVAAMRPIALNEDAVDQSVIAKEIEIGMEVARQEGKAENMLEKIARGKLNKFFKENTLLNQQFVKDNSKTIAAYLQDKDKDLTVTAFKHVELG